MEHSFYLSRGVSATKDDVHKAIEHLDPGICPGLFCQVLDDPADPDWCFSLHADGAGTKSTIAYLMYRQSGKEEWFAGLARDATVMNTDDLLCIGATDNFYLSNTIGRNAQRIDGALIARIIRGYKETAADFARQGINVILTGGETADVGDLVRTVICDATAYVRLPKAHLIDPANVRPGLAIVALASFGRTNYDQEENSGIGSNGLTAARHALLHRDYREMYPETYAETIDKNLAYCGPYHLEDRLPQSQLTVGQALLSPTRSYLAPVKEILDTLRGEIKAIFHCTGGGLTKARGFGKGIRYVKDNLFATPPLFAAIRETGQISQREMYQVFNMGQRMELVCTPESAKKIIAICQKHALAARVIGYTEQNPDSDQANQVVIRDNGQTFIY